MEDSKHKAKSRKAPHRLWLRGHPSDLAEFQRAVALVAEHVYSRGRSAFYTCGSDYLSHLREAARALHLHLEELDATPEHQTSSSAKWWDQARETILEHFGPGQTFTSADARRVLHASRATPVLTSLVQSGELVRTGHGRTIRYEVVRSAPER